MTHARIVQDLARKWILLVQDVCIMMGYVFHNYVRRQYYVAKARKRKKIGMDVHDNHISLCTMKISYCKISTYAIYFNHYKEAITIIKRV